MNTEAENLNDNPPLEVVLSAGHAPAQSPEAPLLVLDEHGDLRVRGTRVLLESIVAEHEQGASANQIADAYDSVTLEDVRDVLRFCSNHPELVQRYLEIQERRSAESLDRLRKAGLVSSVTREDLPALRLRVVGPAI